MNIEPKQIYVFTYARIATNKRFYILSVHGGCGGWVQVIYDNGFIRTFGLEILQTRISSGAYKEVFE